MIQNQTTKGKLPVPSSFDRRNCWSTLDILILVSSVTGRGSPFPSPLLDLFFPICIPLRKGFSTVSYQTNTFCRLHYLPAQAFTENENASALFLRPPSPADSTAISCTSFAARRQWLFFSKGRQPSRDGRGL